MLASARHADAVAEHSAATTNCCQPLRQQAQLNPALLVKLAVQKARLRRQRRYCCQFARQQRATQQQRSRSRRWSWQSCDVCSTRSRLSGGGRQHCKGVSGAGGKCSNTKAEAEAWRLAAAGIAASKVCHAQAQAQLAATWRRGQQGCEIGALHGSYLLPRTVCLLMQTVCLVAVCCC
jgi:hypothetical protein